MGTNSRSQWNSWESVEIHHWVSYLSPHPHWGEVHLCLRPLPLFIGIVDDRDKFRSEDTFFNGVKTHWFFVLSSINSTTHSDLFTYLQKITIVCSYQKMRYVILILDDIEKIYTHWIWSCEERFILSTSCFSWNSRIPIHSFPYFPTLKRTQQFVEKKQALYHFLDVSENEINRWGSTGESYLVPITILMRRRKAVHCHKEFSWFSSWIVDVLNRIKLTTTTSNGRTEIKIDFVSNVNKTMLFVVNHTQNDRLYCVRFWDTRIWSLRNLTESFSDDLQIVFV